MAAAADALPDDAWVNALGSASPRNVLNALQRRLQASSTHVHALAELYRERAQIEQEYSSRLAKLARSAETGQLNGKNGVEWDRNGGEAKLFDAVVSDLQETSSSHSTLAAALKSDFEQPIRELPNKVVAWRRIHDQEASLDRALKDHDKLSAKLDKASSKKSAKTDQLAAEVNQLNGTISSLTPMVYSTYQRLDEDRLRGLKEVVVRWSTLRGDVATRDGERAETSVAQLLGWETADEVLATGHRLGGGGGGGRAAQRSVPTINTAAPATPSRRASIQSASTDFTPRSVQQKANGSSSNVTTPSQGGGGGLSGLKSMLTRKATSAGRQRSGSEATSTRSSRRPTQPTEMFETLEEHSPARRQTPTGSGSGPGQLNTANAPAVDSEGFSIAPADRHKPLWEDPNELIPTPASAKRETMPASVGSAAGVALPSAIFAAGQQQRSASPGAMQDSADSQDNASAHRLNLALAPTPIQESEEERKAALAKMQQTLQMAPQAPNRRSTIARGRREARNTIQTTPTESGPVPQHHLNMLAKMGQDEEQLADDIPLARLQGTKPTVNRQVSQSSLASSRNPFESPSLQSGGVSGQGPKDSGSFPVGTAVAGGAAGAVLGAGATAFAHGSGSGSGSAVPTAQDKLAPLSTGPGTASPIASPSTAATSPFAQSPASPIASASGAGGAAPAGTQSQSFAAQPPAGSSNGQVSVGPGLRATIVEHVSAYIRQQGSQTTVIVGEIHLSLKPTGTPLPPALHIRLTEFDNLESVSPDPNFLAQVPDMPGEYYLNTEVLAAASATPEPSSGTFGPLLFRYHVLVPEGSETASAPLILDPAFQVKNGETRMILHYRPNTGMTAKLTDLRLNVAFPAEPAVTTTQSKPVTGKWTTSEDGSRVISWTAPVQQSADGKIVARFLTGSQTPLQPAGCEAHFVLGDHLLSGLGIDVVNSPDGPRFAFDNVTRSVVSDKYVGDISPTP